MIRRYLSSAVFFLLVAAYLCAALAKDPRAVRSLVACNNYLQHDEIGDLLTAYEQTYPDVARRLIIGESVRGRELLALRVSADPDVESAEPEVRIVGGIHGNECLSVQLVLEVIEVLLNGYGDAEAATELIDNTELVFVPLVNPDGYSGPLASRENARGIDLNRNFGFAWIDEGPRPFSEPESKALRELSLASTFVLGISYHTVAKYVNSVWNYTPHHPPDAALIEAIGQAYAGDTGYRVTFGWDWYAIYGDLNDWSYGTTGTFDWTVELRSDLNLEADVHGTGLQAFLGFAFRGVRGSVIRRGTGEPLPARIRVEPEGAPVFTDPDVGDFHRILLPGTYTLSAWSPGYVPVRLENVAVPDAGAAQVEFELEPAEEGAPRFAFAVVGTTLPQVIGPRYRTEEYLNDTLAWDALGPPDKWGYSLSPGGSITVDMGPGSSVTDREGPDIGIMSATGSDDPVRVLVAEEQDDDYVEIGEGEGDFSVDLSGSGLSRARYIRLVDLGDGPFNEAFAGYDLDAVARLGDSAELPDAGADGDVDVDTDADSDTDADDGPGDSGGSDSGDPGDIVEGVGTAGCGCGSIARPCRADLFSALIRLL